MHLCIGHMRPLSRIKRNYSVRLHATCIGQALWIKKWTKLRLSKKYDWIRLSVLNFALGLLYMQGLSVQNTRSLKRTGQELSSGMSQPSALLARQHSGPSLTRTPFSRSYLRFFSESAWISNLPGTFPLRKSKKNLPKAIYLWNTTTHPVQPGQWLMALQTSGSRASNKASTVGSTAFSGVCFGKFFSCNASALFI